MTDSSPFEITQLGGVGDGQTDNSPAFARYVALLQDRGGGTIAVPDGVYGLSQSLILPPKIHIQMTPGATLLALPGFQGDAVVQIGETDKNFDTGGWPNDQYLLNGKIDGNRQPLIGLRLTGGLGVTVENLIVQNALKTGIEIGVQRGHEMCLSKVRVVVDRGTEALPDSKGIHFIQAHDSVVRDAVVTGYATSVWNSASSNNFHMVHVWNYDTNVLLKTCFYDEGNNNSYVQCYADGPTVPEGEIGYGWYLKGPHTRIVSSQLYASHWTERDTMIGIYVAPEARACTFMANYFMVNRPTDPHGGRKRHDMKAAFAGSLDGACIVGNTYSKWISDGKLFGLPGCDIEERSGGSPED
jgi:hypothetical protein